jgi:hypothetical protein
MPGFAHRPSRRHPQRYLHLQTTAAEEVALWKFADCAHFADAHAGCNIYSCMNVDWLHQLLKGLCKDHTWEWIVSFLKEMYGKEKGLDLIDERFSIIPRFSNIRQFGDKLTRVKQWTGAEYKDMLKVWLAALAPLLKGHPDHFKFIKSVTDFILITSYHSHTETTLKYLQDALSGISSNIHLFLPYRKSHSMSKIPKIHSLLHYIECIREMGSADNSDTEISEAAHKNLIKDGYRSSNKVNYIPQMLRWETRLFHIKSRVSILLHIVKLDPLSPKADICRKLLVGDSLASDKLSPGLIPRINGVMSKRNTIATLTFPEGISISEFIDALTSYLSTFQADTSARLDLRTSGSRASWILRQKIYRANGVTVTIQQHNNPDTVVVQMARCVEKWRGQGNRFDNILIQGDRAPRNNSWVRQQGYCPAKLLYAFRFSDRINTGEANANGSVIWRTVHHDLLFVEDLEYLSSAMPNRTHGMIMCRDAPQRVRRIVDVSSVLAPVQLVPSGEDNQYLLNQYASLESYNMIY